MNIQIEKLKPEEVIQFHEIFKAVMEKGYDYPLKVKEYFINRLYSLANFDYWLKYGYKTILVPKIGTVPNVFQIIGFLVYDEPYGGVLLCRWLGIVSEFRHQGIGKMLMAEFVKDAQALGCHKVEVAVQFDARDFYEKCGLSQEGFRSKSYFGQDQYLFGKVIGEVDEEKVTKK